MEKNLKFLHLLELALKTLPMILPSRSSNDLGEASHRQKNSELFLIFEDASAAYFDSCKAVLMMNLYDSIHVVAHQIMNTGGIPITSELNKEKIRTQLEKRLLQCTFIESLKWTKADKKLIACYFLQNKY